MVDHTASQATFVEISFGVNTLFAVYRDLRVRLQAALSKKVEDYVARAQVIEDPKIKDRVKNIAADLSDRAEKHVDFQCKVEKVVTVLSSVAAVCCIVILYFDWLDALGKWLIFLVLPFPLYMLIWVSNYPIFMWRGKKKLSRFGKFRSEFEPYS